MLSVAKSFKLPNRLKFPNEVFKLMYVDAAVVAGLAVVVGCIAICAFGIRFIRENIMKDGQ